MKIVRLAFAATLVLVIGGCSSSATTSDSDTTGTDPPFPPATCEPGTMPTLAGATCAPVGTTSCAEGFEKDASGWGCTAILPNAPCSAPMRAQLGKRQCVPVDDCAAPFPPAGATVVTQGGATTLDAALKAAPRGATIAVDNGSYDLSFVATRDVNVVGRCASKVTLRNVKSGVFTVGDGANLDLRSVSLVAPADNAVYVIQNGHATLTKVIITDAQFAVTSSRNSTVRVVSSLLVGSSKYAAAEQAAGAALRAGVITFEDVDMHDYPAAIGVFNEGSKISLLRSAVTYDGPSREGVLGLAGAGGVIEVKESRLLAPRTGILDVNDAPPVNAGTNPGGKGATAHVVASEISQAGAPKPTDYVVLVHDAGHATFEETTFNHAADVAIRVLGGTSGITTKTSVFRVATPLGMEHAAIHVLDGASAEVEDTALLDPVQYGIVTLSKGSRLTMTRSFVSGTGYRPTSEDGKSAGVALALSVVEGAEATVSASTILGSQQYGIHTGLGSTVTASDVFIDATSAPESVFLGGSGIIVDETARIAVLRCAIRGSADAAFVFRGGGSVVGESTIIGNGVVLRLAGANLSQLPAAPSGEGSPDVVFYANHIHDNKLFTSPELPPAIVPPPFHTTP